MSQSLRSCLEDFREKVNQHPRLRTLLKGWERVVTVEGSDTGSQLSMPFTDSRITSVVEGEPPPGTGIRVRALEQLLIQVFSGALNPATAFLNGELQVFADDRDQIKLDAITLVLWD
jgi:hypothetical protein